MHNIIDVSVGKLPETHGADQHRYPVLDGENAPDQKLAFVIELNGKIAPESWSRQIEGNMTVIPFDGMIAVNGKQFIQRAIAVDTNAYIRKVLLCCQYSF